MITNVPSNDDFSNESHELFDLAWDLITELLVNLQQMMEWIANDEDEAAQQVRRDSYWSAARRRLTTALSLIQQGVEFGIKSRIAATSPFLLLADATRAASSSSLDFCELRTIDAQDLVRVHDAFTSDRLDPEFVRRFTALRATRNRLVHTVSREVAVAVTETVETLLYMHHALYPGQAWGELRARLIEKSPVSFVVDELDGRVSVWREVALVVDALPPAAVKKYFRIDKKARRYKCPHCLDHTDGNFELFGHLAQLVSTAGDGPRLYCPICDAVHDACAGTCDRDCPSTIFTADGDCLMCYRDE